MTVLREQRTTVSSDNFWELPFRFLWFRNGSYFFCGKLISDQMLGLFAKLSFHYQGEWKSNET